MRRKATNLVAIVVMLAAGSALALPASGTTSISKCKSGSRVCYCTHGCTAGGGDCSCKVDL